MADPPPSFPPPLDDAEARAGFPHGIPSLEALGYPPLDADVDVLFKGGETEGLARLHAQLVRGPARDAGWRCGSTAHAQLG